MRFNYTLQITATTLLPTQYGAFRFESFRFEYADQPHLALAMGLTSGAMPLIRLHSECISGDVFHSVKCDCGDQLRDAMSRIGHAGCGVIIYLRQEGRGIGIENKIRAYALQETGIDTVDANISLGLPIDARTYEPAVAYLAHLGIERCTLLTNNPEKVNALRDFGIDVVREPLRSARHKSSLGYLATKRTRMGHYG